MGLNEIGTFSPHIYYTGLALLYYSDYNHYIEVRKMPDYKEIYLSLFRATENALKLIDKCDILAAKEALINAQQQAEEMYIEN